MEDFVKLELPEVTEFDVYLDIDGADEDEEDSTQSGNATAHTLPLYSEKTAVAEVPWQSDLHSPGHIGNNVATGVLQGETPVASTSAHSPHVDKSDEDEIDIDTPYDGKLMGQTQPKAEITRSPQSLLNRLISFARESNSLPNDDKNSITAARKSVARKSTTPTLHSSKLVVTKNVAVKSTTPRKPSNETLTNVARKSSTKQSKPATNRTGIVSVKPDSNLLQVKFVSGKSQLRSVPNILSRSGNKVTPGMSAVSVSSKSHSQTPRKIFTCNEKSGEGIACPECCLVVKQLSLRGHLKNKHNMSMHICKRCRLTFIDVDQYSEHYALHLQEEEDRNAGISSPLQLPPKPSKPFVTRKLPAIAREPSLRRPASDIPTVSNEMTSPIQRKLPLKSGKSPSNSSSESLPSDAKGPSSSFSRLSFSSSPSSSGKTLPLQPKLPPKPRKPSASKKKHSSPVTIRRPSSSSSSLSSESHRARRTSVGSLQSEASSSSDIAEVTRPTSIHYRESQKTAFRRGQKRSVSPVDVQGAKRQRLGKDVLAAVSKKLCNKEATVSVVSLETASRPYDCTLCLAAFDVALVCPRAFRKHSQDKPFTCSNCPAAFTRSDLLRIHQESQCNVADSDSAPDKDGSLDAAAFGHHKTAGGSQTSQYITVNSPAQSDVQGDFYECHVCKQRFQYRSLLLRHIPYHSSQYSCGFCKKAYEQKEGLLDHFQIMHEGRIRLLCRYCERKFENLVDFERHVRAHKGGTVVACTVCKKKFSDSRLMLKHLKTFHAHTLTPLVCNVCGKKFQQAQHLSAHMKIAHGTSKAIVTKFLSCRFCSKVFHKKQGLSSHYRLCHGMSIAEALSTIGSKGASAATTKSKQKAPVPNVQSRPKVPSSKSNAQTKEKASVAAENKNHECSKCGRSYSDKKHLESHYRNIHGVEVLKRETTRPQCKMCGRKVHTLQGLKTHYKLIHKQEMPLLKTASKNEGPHRCTKCGKCFSYRSNLFRHTKIFHSTKSTSTKTSFSVKPVSHRLGKPWPCRVCAKPFVTRKSMRLHMKRCHPHSYQDERLGTRKCACGKLFSNKTGLLEHRKICGKKRRAPKEPVNRGSSSGRFPCTLCEKTFTWVNSVARHLRITHKLTKRDIDFNMTVVKARNSKEPGPAANKTVHLCKVCKEGFLGRRSYKRHLNRTHGTRTGFFQCRKRFCRKTFTKNENFQHHIKVAHPGMLPYRCVVCKSQFSCSSNLLRHVCFPIENSEVSSNSQHEEEAMGSQPLEHECRYRCMTCGMGFHIAREWTRHMQEHHDDARAGTACYETVMDDTEKIRLNIFDVISAGNVIRCSVCESMFTDKEALNQHSCQKPSKHSKAENPTTAKSKYTTTQERTHVKCPVCLKFFSPHSIKRHLKVLHSLPMRVCKKCNLVFTDVQRFKRHCHESHREQEKTAETEGGVSNASSAVEPKLEAALTFYACQSCEGLFGNADALQMHDCVGEESPEQPPVGNLFVAQDAPTVILGKSQQKNVDFAVRFDNAIAREKDNQATDDNENIGSKSQRQINTRALDISSASSTEHVMTGPHFCLSDIHQIKEEVDESVFNKQIQKDGSSSLQEHTVSERMMGDNIDQTGDGRVESDVHHVLAAEYGHTDIAVGLADYQKGVHEGAISDMVGLFTTENVNENPTEVVGGSGESRNENPLKDTYENRFEDDHEKQNEDKPMEHSTEVEESMEKGGRVKIGQYQENATCVLGQSSEDLQTELIDDALKEKHDVSSNENVHLRDRADSQDVNPAAVIPAASSDEVPVEDMAGEPRGHQAGSLRTVQTHFF